MRDLGVGWIFSKDGRVTKLSPQYPLAYFFDKNGKILLKTPKLNIRSPQEWSVSGHWIPEATSLILAEPFYPGWKAFLNGERVAMTPWNSFLISIPRPQNKSFSSFDLELLFTPTAWVFLVLFSAAAWALWFENILKTP